MRLTWLSGISRSLWDPKLSIRTFIQFILDCKIYLIFILFRCGSISITHPCEFVCLCVTLSDSHASCSWTAFRNDPRHLRPLRHLIRVTRRHGLTKVYFPKVYFQNVYFQKVYFQKVYFWKVYIFVYFSKVCLERSLLGPNFSPSKLYPTSSSSEL